MSIKAIIVDDEYLAREMLAQMINSLNLNIEIIKLCTDLPEAIKYINQLKPELVFLDIDMPRFKGIEIDQFISNIDFDIIFTTAHQEFAINAIKIGAFDYLLKPLDIDELNSTLIKLLDKKSRKKEIDNITYNRLIVNTIQQIHIIDFKKIIYFKAEGAYTKIITTEAEIIASKNLKFYEDLLENNSLFTRIHKSYIINKEKIKAINKLKQQALMENEDYISISQDKMEKLFT